MKVVFVHDHKFRRVNGEIFSPGGLPDEVLSRYVKWFGALTVIGRIIEEKEAKSSYSKITNPNVTVLTAEDLEKTVKSSDCVISRIPSINGYKAIHLAKRHRIPYLVEVVGCTFDAYWNYGLKGKFLAVPAFFVMRHYVKNAPYVLYVTSEFLQKRYPCKGKTIGVSDVSIENTEPEKNHLEQEKLWANRKTLVLGTVAAVDVRYKGQEYVIKAIPLIEAKLGIKVKYELIGSGSPKELQKIAEEAEVADRVVIRGTIPHQEVFRWLDKLDGYIQPSMTEGLSRALIEAMSRGLPCIASNSGGNSELIDSRWIVSTTPRGKFSNRIGDAVCRMFSGSEFLEASIRNKRMAFEKYSSQYLNARREEFYYSFASYVLERRYLRK